MSTLVPALRTICSATSTGAGWPTTTSLPTGPPTAPSGRWPTGPRSRCATSSPRPPRPQSAPRAPTRSDRRPVRQLHGHRRHRDAAASGRCSTSSPASTPRRRRPRWPAARRAAAGRRGRRHRPLRRHRRQELDPLPAAPVAVRPRAARRVVLPRPAARRDPRRLPEHIARMFALVYGEHEVDDRPPRGSSRWRPSSPPRTGTW